MDSKEIIKGSSSLELEENSFKCPFLDFVKVSGVQQCCSENLVNFVSKFLPSLR